MSALNLNLLDPAEQRASSSAQKPVLLLFLGSCALLACLAWAGFVGIQLSLCKGKVGEVRAAVARLDKEAAESKRLKAKLEDQQSEAWQYALYCRGRQERGELLKRLAFAIPESITLTELTIPPPPRQLPLRRPSGSKDPVPQGPTQMVERVELRLAGTATGEEDVFQLMRALEGNAFTGLVAIVKQPVRGERESPRVLSFRQDAPTSKHRGVVFDIVYDITPREFVQ